MPAYISSTQHNKKNIAGYIQQYYSSDRTNCITPSYQDGLNRPSFFPLVGKNPGCKNDPLSRIELENKTNRYFLPDVYNDRPSSNSSKLNYITIEPDNKYDTVKEGTPMEVRELAIPNVFRTENLISYNMTNVSQDSVPVAKKLKNTVKVDSSIATLGLQERNKSMIEENPANPKKVGGCKGTRFGCCSDGVTAKNKSGSNCPKMN